MNFILTFRCTPAVLPENTRNSNYTSSGIFIRDYGETCKIYVFLHLFSLNYVVYDNVDMIINTQEVYTRISDFLQNRSVGGYACTNTPKKLLDKFKSLAVILPETATTWSIHLYSTYFSEVPKDLVKNIPMDIVLKNTTHNDTKKNSTLKENKLRKKPSN